MAALVDQLKHRGVFRAAAYYAAGAWLVVQVATAVFPFLEFPNWSVRLIIVSVIAGFPVAMLVSWFYRWTPSALQREIEPANHARVVAPAAPARENAIAVLPFADLSPQKDQEYFADGLAEELLGLLPQLQVIARSSSFSFKGRNLDVRTIASKLGVASVLEGSVRKSGNRLACDRAIDPRGRRRTIVVADLRARADRRVRGERDAAFEWLERAYAQRDAGVTRVRGDPILAPLRDDPRYVAFVRKLNFPDFA